MNRLAALAIGLIPAAALAHPGHGTLSGILHGFEPLHALPIAAVALVGYWGLRRIRKARNS